MRKLFVVLALVVSAVALAETWIGTIIVNDGGTASNRTTGTPFAVPPSSPISIQPDQDCYVCTDLGGCDAGVGVAISAGQLFPTATGPIVSHTGLATNPDGGAALLVAFTGNFVAVTAHNSDGGYTCASKVFSRNGKE